MTLRNITPPLNEAMSAWLGTVLNPIDSPYAEIQHAYQAPDQVPVQSSNPPQLHGSQAWNYSVEIALYIPSSYHSPRERITHPFLIII